METWEGQSPAHPYLPYQLNAGSASFDSRASQYLMGTISANTGELKTVPKSDTSCLIVTANGTVETSGETWRTRSCVCQASGRFSNSAEVIDTDKSPGFTCLRRVTLDSRSSCATGRRLFWCNSGLTDGWRSGATEWFCYLRHIQDSLTDWTNLPYENRLKSPFDGPTQ